MRNFENKVLGSVFQDFDHTVKYDDAYYEAYIESFQPNFKQRWGYRFIKRAFDLVCSALALVILSPVMLLIVVAIRCDSEGPIVFKQLRMGRNGKPFYCYKFRSMKITAPTDCATSMLENPEQYLTRVGRVLRRLSLDELPQLFCCVIGTMSIIGYRPVVLTEENCNEMRRRLGVFTMRPGISGLAQVFGRDDVYYKNKAILDSQYVKHASLLLDIYLLFKTVWVVIKREGNDAEKIEQKQVDEPAQAVE